jgi:hypothetical protein
VGDLDHTGRAELRRRFFPAMARAKWPEQVALFAVSAVVLQRHREECDRRGQLTLLSPSTGVRNAGQLRRALDRSIFRPAQTRRTPTCSRGKLRRAAGSYPRLLTARHRQHLAGVRVAGVATRSSILTKYDTPTSTVENCPSADWIESETYGTWPSPRSTLHHARRYD